jgi:hypothetical protein
MSVQINDIVYYKNNRKRPMKVIKISESKNTILCSWYSHDIEELITKWVYVENLIN